MTKHYDDAFALVEHLSNIRPNGMTSDELTVHFSWAPDYRHKLMPTARAIADEFDLVIPMPTYGDGYVYRVEDQLVNPSVDVTWTESELAVIRQNRTRAQSMQRDISIMLRHYDGRTHEGRLLRDLMTFSNAMISSTDQLDHLISNSMPTPSVTTNGAHP